MPRIDPARPYRDRLSVRWNPSKFCDEAGVTLSEMGRNLGFRPASFAQQCRKGATSLSVFKAMLVCTKRDGRSRDYTKIRISRSRAPLFYGDVVARYAREFDRKHKGLTLRMDDGAVLRIAGPGVEPAKPSVESERSQPHSEALSEARINLVAAHLRAGKTPEAIERHYVWDNGQPGEYFAEVARRFPDLVPGVRTPVAVGDELGDAVLDAAMQLLARAVNSRTAMQIELESARADVAQLEARAAQLEQDKKDLEEMVMDTERQRDIAVHALGTAPLAVPAAVERRLEESAKRAGMPTLAQEIAALPK